MKSSESTLRRHTYETTVSSAFSLHVLLRVYATSYSIAPLDDWISCATERSVCRSDDIIHPNKGQTALGLSQEVRGPLVLSVNRASAGGIESGAP